MKYCPHCGKEIFDDAVICPSCGSQTSTTINSDRSWLTCLLLCFFLGVLGIHRFYVGKTGTGILMFLTLGGFGLWVLIDFIMILGGTFKDSDGFVVTNKN